SKGSQNLSWNYPNSGAFTGEVSGQMLAESGCKYVLIGHSERRQYFGENNEILSKKLEFALQNNLTPIFCFGESLEDFQNNQTLNVIEQQLSIVNDSKNIIFAYEPIWSIGTGLVPKKSDVSKVCDFIKKKFANDAKIVYGGSVNSGNAEEILNEWPVVGILVGGSSLKLEEFQKIIDFA
ncbi:MAG: triosephosphate isomerase, partial [Alphaproteobacteria bacterium]|nr:triosephosphate isomerase [Alphaproteobacteria bacterium]